MKLSLSADDRISPDFSSDKDGNSLVRWLIWAGLVPLTLLAVAASGWYVVTGETPDDLADNWLSSTRISLPMPPRLGPEKSAASLLRPPSLQQANDPDVKMTMAAIPATPSPATTPSTPQPTVSPPPVVATSPAATPSKVPETPVVEPPKPAAAAQTAPQTAPISSASAPAAPTAAAATAVSPAEKSSTTAPPPPPALDEPPVPDGSDLATPPSFAQLPAPKDEVPPLAPGPLPELLRNSSRGALPIMAGGRTASKAYARPFRATDNKPRIAIVVTGLGLSKEATQAAIFKLPPEITLSFSPYGSALNEWISRARESGHEVLIDLPLETDNLQTHDPGPMAILSNHSPGEAIDRLETILVRGNSYVGIAGALHSPVAAADSWGPLLQNVRNRGLLFIGDGLVGVADSNMPEAASVTLVADETPFRAAIDNHLARLLLAAQRDGTAIAYLSARPVSFERLIAWIGTLPDKGAVLAPVSAVVRPKP